MSPLELVDAALRARRPPQPDAERGGLAQRRGGARSGAQARRRDRERDARPASVRRRADPDQGPDPGARLARHLRLPRCARGYERRGRARHRGLQEGGLHPVRPDQHTRVRAADRHRERPLRDNPQPVGHEPHARWLERRRRCVGGVGDVLGRARQRRRGIDPDTGVVLRSRRAEARARPRAVARARLAGHGDRRVRSARRSPTPRRSSTASAGPIRWTCVEPRRRRRSPSRRWSGPTPGRFGSRCSSRRRSACRSTPRADGRSGARRRVVRAAGAQGVHDRQGRVRARGDRSRSST